MFKKPWTGMEKLKGVRLKSQAVARRMIDQGGGRIINIRSISGLRARANGTGA